MAIDPQRKLAEFTRKLTRVVERVRGEEGISLAETVVALMLFAAGALPIAGSSIELGAMVNAVHQRSRALSTAERQAETLLRQPYAALTDGSRTADGITLSWTVENSPLSKKITLVYTYDLRDEVRQDTLTAARLLP